MTFADRLDQALMLLQRYSRVTYRTLQIQLQLDDEYFAALKEQLLYAHLEVWDDAGRGLIWTGTGRTPPRWRSSGW